MYEITIPMLLFLALISLAFFGLLFWAIALFCFVDLIISIIDDTKRYGGNKK